ncbi:hypothetical protein STEG23_007136 [Scotinomys teguina]
MKPGHRCLLPTSLQKPQGYAHESHRWPCCEKVSPPLDPVEVVEGESESSSQDRRAAGFRHLPDRKCRQDQRKEKAGKKKAERDASLPSREQDGEETGLSGCGTWWDRELSVPLGKYLDAALCTRKHAWCGVDTEASRRSSLHNAVADVV